MSIRQTVLAAMTAALSAGMSELAQAAGDKTGKRCADFVKAGQNDCAGPAVLAPAPGARRPDGADTWRMPGHASGRMPAASVAGAPR